MLKGLTVTQTLIKSHDTFRFHSVQLFMTFGLEMQAQRNAE